MQENFICEKISNLINISDQLALKLKNLFFKFLQHLKKLNLQSKASKFTLESFSFLLQPNFSKLTSTKRLNTKICLDAHK